MVRQAPDGPARPGSRSPGTAGGPPNVDLTCMGCRTVSRSAVLFGVLGARGSSPPPRRRCTHQARCWAWRSPWRQRLQLRATSTPTRSRCDADLARPVSEAEQPDATRIARATNARQPTPRLPPITLLPRAATDSARAMPRCAPRTASCRSLNQRAACRPRARDERAQPRLHTPATSPSPPSRRARAVARVHRHATLANRDLLRRRRQRP